MKAGDYVESPKARTIEWDRVWIVVPAFDEGPVIVRVVEGLLARHRNVVVVDDGSRDNTYACALATSAHVLRHVVNLGQGAALRTGLDYALAHGAEVLVTFDADDQHHVKDIEPLVDALEDHDADIALGSRFLREDGRSQIPRRRRWLLRAAIVFTRVVSGIRLTDTHNGLRAMRADAVRRLAIEQPRMAHASELLHGIVRHGLRYVEVPVTVTYSDRSRSKGQASLDALNVVFDLMVRRLMR